MKKRFQLPLFALIVFAVSGAHGQTTFTWSATPFDHRLSTPANWTGGSLPTTDGSAQLVFGLTNQSFINFDIPTVQIYSLAFTSPYAPYHFNSFYGATLIIGSGGVSVPASGNTTVVSDSNIFVELAGSQTWDIGGHLTVRGMISDAPDFTSSLTKTGAGTLRLEAHNNFAGDFTLNAGTLEIAIGSEHEGGFIYVSPVGLGTLTLGDNTTLRSADEDIQLHNNIALGNNVTLDSGDGDDLELAGTVTVANASTTIKVSGDQPSLFTGIIDGPNGTHLTFTSPNGEFGSAAFADVFSTDNIAQLTADRAALFFFFNLPTDSPLVLHAVNNGYIGAAAAPEFTHIPAPSPAALLARITSPSTFAGTFGLDTAPESILLHHYTDDLDFSAFKHPAFRFGSHSDAIMSGQIKPVDLGSTALYPFGGGSGHLGVLTDLSDPNGKPASILVSNPPRTSPQYVIFRGNNTTTGTYTLDGVAAHLAVENGIAVLDSPNALPGGASGKFAFGAGAPAYIGATEAAFADFNTFLSHLAPGGHNSLSILGLDSHDAFDVALYEGVDSDNYEPRVVSQSIDLRNFTSIYLGTASDVILSSTVHAPSNGILKLTAVDDGLLAIAAPLGSNVTSVEIGFAAGTAAEKFGDGTIEMIAPQTYAGGTTLHSGTLMLGVSSNLTHDQSAIANGPIGLGTLTVENGVSEAVLAAANSYTELHNDIVLNADLRIGDFNDGDDSDYGGIRLDFNSVGLHGDISGGGGLVIYGNVELHGHNSYEGGTLLAGFAHLGSSDSLGPGLIEVRNVDDFTAGLSAYGDIVLSNDLLLDGDLFTYNPSGSFTFEGDITLHRTVTLGFYGVAPHVTGDITGFATLFLQNSGTAPLWLSGANSYTGGTELTTGSLVFATPASIPANGLIRGSFGTYVGAAFDTNIRSNFLDRFDKSGNGGSIGFDSTDVNDPIIVAENIDLSSFSLSTRLGTATSAIITGTITPPGLTSSPYTFGGGGGTLTVSSNLGEGRGISVTSSITQPLTLVLEGDNRDAFGLNVSSSIVRFDGADALPSMGSFSVSNYGYVGYTEVVDLTPNGFMTRWSSAGSGAILGFDSVNPGAPRTITDPISLVFTSAFNSSTYIGTSTAVNLNGTLTPFGDTLRLTGVGSGNLIVNSILGAGSVTSLVVGTVISELSGNAAVTLNGDNTYTGGTELVSSHLILGHASALGTGALRVTAPDARLSVNSSHGLTIANDVQIDGYSQQLTLDGENPFTLSGEISGEGTLVKTGDNTVTLSGDNADFPGEVAIENGKLVFAGNTSAGTGTLSFWSELGIAEFLSDAPVLGGLSSHYAGSQILLAKNSVLTVNLGSPTFSVDHPSLLAAREIEPSSATFFYGSIAGDGASVVYTTPADQQATLYLAGPSSYTGGTTINTGVTVHASDPAALGLSGPVNLHGGHLRVSSGTNLAFTSTRPLVFTSGSLGGGGTLSFESSLIIGAEHTLSPGNSIGVLSLSFNPSAALVLDSGGTYRWELSDATGTAGTGWDLIHVAGNVDVAALASADNTFNITLHTIDSSGLSGYAANFNPNNSYYSWAILTATSITNFDPAKFNLFAASTTFLNDTAGGTFSLSLENNNTILLNFTPVPEPSTWALMITGLAAIAFTALRRRRA